MQVVIGSGPVGSAIATLLAERGEPVRLITRSGRGPEHPLIERIALDARDATALRAATGAPAASAGGDTVIYNAANPSSYTRWAKEWPPLADAVLEAARAHGATLAIIGNLYAYGPVDRPMTEDLPLASTEAKGRLRARIWLDALAAHERGELRALEIRASDYIGPGGMSHLNRAADLLLRGKRVDVVGSLDQPHTWTSSYDTARLAVAAATDPTAHGRAWHVPSNPPRTQRQVIHDLARAAGLPEPKVGALPHAVLRAVGLFLPQLREVAAVSYQFDRPFVMDDSQARAHFAGFEPTPWETLVRSVTAAAGTPTLPAAGR